MKFLYNFLQKEYRWDHALSSAIKKTWRHVAGVRYNDKLGKWRKKYGTNRKPNSVPQEIWSKWWEYWRSDEFKALSSQAAQNRRSKKAGERSRPSKHTGGSRTIIQHSMNLVKVFFQFIIVNFICMQ